MSRNLRIIAYLVLTLAAVVLGFGFFSNLTRSMNRPIPGEAATNQMAAASTNASATNSPVATDTNLAHAATNAADLASSTSAVVSQPVENHVGTMMTFGAGLLAVFVLLGLLLAHDISRWFANRVENFIFNDEGEGIKNPEYEQAEQVWADGRHLEAIQLMREYLKKHPREQFVALRIAEIYEKDLGNPLAAALEYEEILRKKLPPDRWGWAAIHLANLYSGKLDKIEKATALLCRIVEEYGQTSAAKKARERLGLPEPAVADEPEGQLEVEEQKSEPSHLPPGFRPK
ncbi:MAG TPA: hypothetical protein VGK40_12035 [Verrucomicrobiae bacterium]